MSIVRQQLQQYRQGDAVCTVDGQVRCDYLLPESFCGFAGHFPDFPIVPAVIQVMMAQILVEEYLPQCAAIGGIQRAKFLRQIKPDENIQVCCSTKTVRNRKVVDVLIEVDGSPAATMLLLCVNGEK